MQNNELNTPHNNYLSNSDITMPYIFISNEAFPSLDNLMKPHSRNQLNLESEYFNKRLSRARKTVECTFGLIFSKWRIVSKAIERSEKTTDRIIKAICVLHNTIIDKEGYERHLKDIIAIPPSFSISYRHS